MILFPNAKINIGLNIVSRRNDGFHDIETIFYPLKGLCDILEVISDPDLKEPYVFTQTGLRVDGAIENNLCVKAYKILSEFIKIPPVKIHLHKQIPFGAGLGGGSSDGVFTLSALNALTKKPLPHNKLMEIALMLGSDCPFFLINTPCFATGRGEKLYSVEVNLNGYFFLLAKPNINVNTGKAYSLSTPKSTNRKLPELIKSDVSDWTGTIVNDFEKIVFELFPEIEDIKKTMYKLGATYSAMSGSGSTVFGLFTKKPAFENAFENYYTFCQKLLTHSG